MARISFREIMMSALYYTDFYSASSLQQHCVGRYVTLLCNIIPIPS